jgi:two-component system cell cycle response regulator
VHHDKVRRELKEKAVELEQQSVSDSLTELRSRRYFMDRGQQDLAFCQRRDKDLTLIRVDINHYSELWSSHSKERMDALLKWLGKLLLSNARVEDTVACLGGPEFGILAMATDMAGALVVCDRLRETLVARPFNDDNITIPITLSIGVATLGADHAQSMDELLTVAQERLSQPYPPVIAEPQKTPGGDPMEELSVEELEQLIRQEVSVAQQPGGIDVKTALALLAQGEDEALLPHLDQLMKQLQPLMDLYQAHVIKKSA